MGDRKRQALARELIAEMERTGDLDELRAELKRRPGSRIQVRKTTEGGFEVYVSGDEWRSVMVLLVVCAGLAAIFGVAGLGIAWLFRELLGGIDNLPVLGLYRGILLGALAGLVVWFHEGEWGRSPARFRVIEILIIVIAFVAIARWGFNLDDLQGTLAVCFPVALYVVKELM